DLCSTRDLLLDLVDRSWFDLAPVLTAFREQKFAGKELPQTLKFWERDHGDLYVIKLLLRAGTDQSQTEQIETKSTRKIAAELQKLSREVGGQRKFLGLLDRRVTKCEKLLANLSSDASPEFSESER